MHAKQSQPTLPRQSTGAERPLATSAFKGQARLRELEHLANTARKVRDQAASELTRGGSTHHIARDRISAAERMLSKANREIAELRAQLDPELTNPTAATKPKDFELAMLLGHSKSTFNRDEAGQVAYEIQQDSPLQSAGKTTRRTQPKPRSDLHTKSPWRTLAFAVLISLGAGLGAAGTYALATTGSVSEAGQVVRDGTFQLVDKLRTLIPALSLSAGAVSAPISATTLNSAIPVASVVGTHNLNAQQVQEQQARAAADQRLSRQIAGLK